ncbi:hypothetical protein EYF80_055890 [Liparis tanakae]|uniref:Uncharacterized protein n=1 Tax=Liparis tanakae TaxID=230148 RepID=A0A4Z2EY92_9TELE|nr:hypothetical protein EYF80_055890 [Liparis tanakae]
MELSWDPLSWDPSAAQEFRRSLTGRKRRRCIATAPCGPSPQHAGTAPPHTAEQGAEPPGSARGQNHPGRPEARTTRGPQTHRGHRPTGATDPQGPQGPIDPQGPQTHRGPQGPQTHGPLACGAEPTQGRLPTPTLVVTPAQAKELSNYTSWTEEQRHGWQPVVFITGKYVE